MPYLSTSGGDIVDDLTDRMGENILYWISQEKLDAFNEAYALWQFMTGELVTTQEVDIIPSQIFYEVPRQIVGVNRVLWNGTPLMETSLESLDKSSTSWQNTVAGTPRKWAPLGITQILITPPALTGVLTFEGIEESPVLMNLGDKVNLADDAIEPLLSYASHYLSFKEGGAEFTASQTGVVKLVEAAVNRNSELIQMAPLRRYMGKDQGEILRNPRSGQKNVGARA